MWEIPMTEVIETCLPSKKSFPSSCGADTMSTTLELFWNLSSSKKRERLDTTAKLVITLHKFQSEFTPAEVSDGEEITDSAQADTLDTLNAQDVSYSIRRLIRGLASPRESSRLGFAVALTEVRLVAHALYYLLTVGVQSCCRDLTLSHPVRL